MAEHKIVLASVAEGSEAGVGSALAEILGAPESLTQEIARSAPIVILSGLAPEQAAAVLEAMELVKQSGGGLAISAAAAESMPQVNWPEAPTVGGRGIETYRPGYVPPSTPPSAPPAPAQATARPAGSASLFCPHCGNAISVQISAGGAPRPPSAAALPAAGIAQAPGVLADVPDVTGQPVPQRPPSGTGSPSGPMDLEEFEKGVGGGGGAQPKGDDLLRQLDAALPAKDPGLRALEMAPPQTPARAAQPSPPALPARPQAPAERPKRKQRPPPGRRRRDRRR